MLNTTKAYYLYIKENFFWFVPAFIFFFTSLALFLLPNSSSEILGLFFVAFGGFVCSLAVKLLVLKQKLFTYLQSFKGQLIIQEEFQHHYSGEKEKSADERENEFTMEHNGRKVRFH